MNIVDKLNDKQFIPFLQSLGVDTRNQSFEWMLNNSDFAPALEWIYNNLDSNNVLNIREKRRFIEIQKQNAQLCKEVTSNELEESIDIIKEQYPGICFPGEYEAIENIKFSIKAQRERLNLLEKQEIVIKNLIKQNEQNNDRLNLEITKINAAHQQVLDEEKKAAEECIKLAREVDDLTGDLIAVVSQNIDLYATCGDNKETAQKFFVFGPFDQYRQSQDLYQSHFDLYVAKKFGNVKRNFTDDNDVLNEAKCIEKRLSKAMSAYIESKAELCGEQAKLQLVTNYNHPHCSQIGIFKMEAQTAVQLLEQEEGILEQQIQHAIKEFAEEQTNVVEFMAIKAALNIREEIHKDLVFLLETTQEAFALDKILYSAVRHELHNIQEFLHFAAHLRQYVLAESDGVANRIDSMREICSEQAACEGNINKSDSLLNYLRLLLGVQSTNDDCLLVKHFQELKRDVRELRDRIEEGYEKKEGASLKLKQSTQPLIDYIWDGSTKQPNCLDTTVATLNHSLRQEMAIMDERIVETSAKYNFAKNGDKQHLRKLWQWFLTDQPKLLAAIKAAQAGKIN